MFSISRRTRHDYDTLKAATTSARKSAAQSGQDVEIDQIIDQRFGCALVPFRRVSPDGTLARYVSGSWLLAGEHKTADGRIVTTPTMQQMAA